MALSACVGPNEQEPDGPKPPTAPRAAATQRADDESGFVSLFDGKNLGQWDGDPRLWSVENGAITGRTTPQIRAERNTFLVWRGGEVRDFELRLRVRISGDNNSGIQYRSREREKWSVVGYQCDVGAGRSDRGSHYAKLSWEGGGRLAPLCPAGGKVVIHPDGRRESLGAVGDAEAIRAGMRDGQWYEFTVIAANSRLEHKVNGQVVVDAIDEEAGARAESGILALQIHSGPPMVVQFKDLRLKTLP